MTADLVAFLRARLDEAEQAANAAASEVGPDWYYDTGRGCVASRHEHDMVATGSQDHLERERGAHIAHHDPARVLRGVEAKRRILGWADSPALPEAERLYVLDALAAVDADHPDYKQEWRP